MAEKRMISKVISISEKVNELPDIFDMLLFTWLIPHTDDFGRLAGSPGKVKSLVLPMLERKSKSDVQVSLANLHKAGLIIWYEAEGDKVIQIVNFEKHQSGLHKRTKSKFPDPPGDSRNFPEIPLEGKGTEEKGKGTEEKGTEGEGSPPTPPVPNLDSNPHKDRIHKLMNECEVKKYTFHHLDQINAFIGVVDIEVIEAAIKKGSKKHVNYAINTLTEWTSEGKTRKEDVIPKPQAGDRNEKSQGQHRHEQSAPEDKPVTGGAVGALPSKWADRANVIQLPNVSG